MEKQEAGKQDEEINIKKLGDGNYEIVRTITETVPADGVEKFFGEITKAIEETNKHLKLVPGQVKEREEALNLQKAILEKRFKAFEPHAKDIIDAKKKSCEGMPEPPAQPTQPAKPKQPATPAQ